MSAKVQGQCPNGCGKTLFLGSGGYVTCSWHACPDPSRANDFLERGDAIKALLDSIIDNAIIDLAQAS